METCQRGCPQGSSLGLLTWNSYQNDLSHVVKSIDFSMYTDDHQLYVSANSINAVEEKLNANGDIASQWYKNNFLQGKGKDKYNEMLLSRVNNDPLMFTLMDKILPTVKN